MPELPEVETVKRGLNRLIVGRKVKSVWFDWPKGFPNSKKDVDEYLVGAKILAVKRRAKVILIELSSLHTLLVHLKMTGQLVYVAGDGRLETGDRKRRVQNNKASNTDSRLRTSDSRWGAGHPSDSLTGNLPDKSTRVDIEFSDGSHLFFNDQRKFGWMRLVATIEVPTIDFMKKFGPEPLSKSFSDKHFIERFRKRSNTAIKAVLLDQTIMAGVGNIYADEALYSAKIHPQTKVKDLSDRKLSLLHKAVVEILTQAIKTGGSTDRNYVNAEGGRGSYLEFARVFRREGQNCPRDGTKIIKIKVAGRGTHICPKCQRVRS